MWVVFSGTSDYRADLFEFLDSGMVLGYTAIRTTWKWGNSKGDGDVLYFFCQDDAIDTQHFLKNDCHQADVPLFEIDSERSQ